MLLVPTVAQMLTVIGAALVLTVVISGAVAYLMARLEQQDSPVAAAGRHDERMPAPSPAASSVAMPGQRIAAVDTQAVPAGR